MDRLRRVGAIVSISPDIDELFERFFGPDEYNAVWEPPVDLFASEERVYLMAELPGVAGSDINVRVGSRAVRIHGTKSPPDRVRRGVSFYESQIPYGRFEKRVSLPYAVNPDNIKVEFRDGILTLELRRVGGPRVIQVE